MFDNKEPEFNFSKLSNILNNIRKYIPLPKNNFFFFIIVILFLIGLWGSSGIFTVQPGEQAALRLFGKFNSLAGPGLHWFFPSPIGDKDIVATDTIRRLELGFRGDKVVPDEALMITGDENIVDAQLLVQFDIKDLKKFLYKAIDPGEKTMMDVAETALRQVVGSKPIDDVLTTEKEAVQSETKILMQSLLDNYDTGIRVREVKLQNVQPPAQVQDAFDDVVRAREDKAKIINLADAYREDILPKARGYAAKVIQDAKAYEAVRIAASQGEADKFNSILKEYNLQKETTESRLYLETIERVLPKLKQIIIGDPNKIYIFNSDNVKQVIGTLED
ncbi:MAG TPA: FtsH protease activity modulator HflK [Dehalococcoidia bacterium]|nr:FtsH protease activity modulator HflK [Dehalococcoidia bacterium]